MSVSLPAFAFCVPSCTDEGCSSQPFLEKIGYQIYRERPDGTAALAKDLLRAWEMSNVTQVATAALMGKKMEIYIPPCGRLIEAALGLSTEISTIQNMMFQDVGTQLPTLRCLIRIDDRIALPSSCSSQSVAVRMQELKKCLKEQSIGFMVAPAPGFTSGKWFADHFDVPYLDRRCYELENAASTQQATSRLSVADMLSENGGAAAGTTGTLFILDKEALADSLKTMSATTTAAREWQMFEIKSKPPSVNEYTAAYFGEYVVARSAPEPISEQGQRNLQQYQRRQHWENEDKQAMKELKSAGSAKGFFKAGLKFGKNKVGKFIDEQKFS